MRVNERLPWKGGVGLSTLPRMNGRVRSRVAALLLGVALALQAGCRRNVLRVSSIPPDAQVYVQGKVVRLEDSNRRLARKIDEKKARGKELTEEEAEFQKNRKRLQGTPVEYEFESVAAGYSLYVLKRGYRATQTIEYIKPKWYEYPPIDLFVDLLPVTITDTREVEVTLEPDPSRGGGS